VNFLRHQRRNKVSITPWEASQVVVPIHEMID
jgi:hypothetical protein